MKKISSTFLIISLISSAPALAANDSEAGKVPAGTYNIDSSHTQVSGRINHLGFSFVTVSFNKAAGSLTYDPAAPEKSSLDITLDATALTSGFAARDEHIKGPQFFNTAAFPTIRYVATSLTRKDPSHAVVNGQLTLLGVTKPVPMEITLIGTGPGMAKDTRVGFTGTARIKRSDFGMKAFLPAISDDVDILVDSEFSKK